MFKIFPMINDIASMVSASAEAGNAYATSMSSDIDANASSIAEARVHSSRAKVLVAQTEAVDAEYNLLASEVRLHAMQLSHAQAMLTTEPAVGSKSTPSAPVIDEACISGVVFPDSDGKYD